MNRISPAPAMLLAALWLAAPAALAEQKIDQWADAHPRGEVEISNVSGKVSVTGWDEDRVHVTGALEDDVERLEFRSDGKYTLIKVILPRGNARHGDATLAVSVPRGSRLTVGTVSADIDVGEVEGALRLQSVSGDVETQAFGEDVRVQTVSGDVGVRGRGEASLVTVTTVAGDARVADVGGELVVQTVTGDLEATASSVERARINTTNGEATLATALAQGARVEMETINGDLTLVLRGEVDAEFDVETFNGRIDSEFGPKPERTSEFAPGLELRFTEGAGSSRVVMESLNGGIIIRRD